MRPHLTGRISGDFIRKYYALALASVSHSNGGLHYLITAAHACRTPRAKGCGSIIMQDILWIGLILALLGASLGYVALCGRA